MRRWWCGPVRTVKQVLSNLLHVPGWAVLLVVGLLVFAEDGLFVGFVLPGETAALVGGVVAKLGHVPLWAVLGTVAVAAIGGDSVGYEVGRRVGPRLLRVRVLDRRRERLRRGQVTLARRGGSAVFLARWVAFLRSVIPALAGIAGMPYRRFLAFNAAGGVTWSAAVVVAGYAVGASYAAVEKTLGWSVALATVAIAVIALLVVWIRRRRHAKLPT